MRGFETYTIFKSNIRDSRQIYDITYHLYQTEVVRLKPILEEYEDKNYTFKTSVNSIQHGPKSLHDRLINLYPYKLRQLILINSITALEVFLTDIILEIFKRDIKPFKQSEPMTFQRNYLLNISSIDNLREDIVKKDFRNLTSGGLSQILKYYIKCFGVDFKNLGMSFKEIEEIHVRRHLFVHRNGIVDSSYVNDFPESGLKANQHIKLSHEYLIYSLDKITEFASLVNKSLLAKFPDTNRQPKYSLGKKYFDKEQKNLMLDISVLKENFDVIEYFKNLRTPQKILSDYIVKIVTYDNTCLLFISGKHSDISSFFKILKESEFLKLNKTIHL